MVRVEFTLTKGVLTMYLYDIYIPRFGQWIRLECTADCAAELERKGFAVLPAPMKRN